MPRSHVPIIGLLLILGGSTASLLGQGPPGGVAADSLYQSKQWPAAAAAYDKAARAEPGNVRLWYRLGIAELSQGHFARAEAAFLKASAIPPGPGGRPVHGLSFYNLAAARARQGKADGAFAALDSAFAITLLPPGQLENDSDFVTLRGDPRFAERVRAARLAFTPCDTIAHARDLDFWVGDWDVYTTARQLAGHSSVQRILASCVILENWTGSLGGEGKSFNWFNTTTREWQQTWVSAQASSTEYREGRLEGNRMVLLAETQTPQGAKTTTRLSFANLGPNKVRQLFEQSADGRQTWVTTTDLIYVRQGSGEQP